MVTIKISATKSGKVLNTFDETKTKGLKGANLYGETIKNIDIAADGTVNAETFTVVVDFIGHEYELISSLVETGSVKVGDIITVDGAMWTETSVYGVKFVHVRVGYELKNGMMVRAEKPVLVLESRAGNKAETTRHFDFSSMPKSRPATFKAERLAESKPVMPRMTARSFK